MKIGYVRVSTSEQSVEQQVDALTEAGCCKIFADEGVSALAKNRPELIKARNALKKGDIFIVWAIDRAFRSTVEAIQFLDDLIFHGITFQSLTQQIDPTTLEGRKWYTDDIASWAEYERGVISRRTKQKMASAKRRGQHFGRPRLLSDASIVQAHKQRMENNVSIASIAQNLDVSYDTLKRGFIKLGLR